MMSEQYTDAGTDARDVSDAKKILTATAAIVGIDDVAEVNLVFLANLVQQEVHRLVERATESARLLAKYQEKIHQMAQDYARDSTRITALESGLNQACDTLGSIEIGHNGSDHELRCLRSLAAGIAQPSQPTHPADPDRDPEPLDHLHAIRLARSLDERDGSKWHDVDQRLAREVLRGERRILALETALVEACDTIDAETYGGATAESKRHRHLATGSERPAHATEGKRR